MGITRSGGLTLIDGVIKITSSDGTITITPSSGEGVVDITVAGGGGVFIKVDGTSVTTAQIPFDQGLSAGTTGQFSLDPNGKLKSNWDAGNFDITCATLNLTASSGQIILDSGSLAKTTLQDSAASSDKVVTLPNATGTLATLANLSQSFAGSMTFTQQILATNTTSGMRLSSALGGTTALVAGTSVGAVTFTFPSVTGTGAILGANIFTGDQTISKATPKLIFTDSGGDDFEISVTTGAFAVRNTTDGRNDIAISNAGNIVLGGAGVNLGFYGGAGGGQPTITGSRGGNAALASLLTALAGLNLIVDSTTA